MKVCIYGAGAIGGWIAGALASAGCAVSLVARGATLEALQQHGLRVQQADALTRYSLVYCGKQILHISAIFARAIFSRIISVVFVQTNGFGDLL
jgi:ketopantoate reductase